jgi:hypothetical protein
VKPEHQEERREYRAQPSLHEGKPGGVTDGARMSLAVLVADVRKAGYSAKAHQQKSNHQRSPESR